MDKFACLKCVLPFCDETADECLYRLPTRKPKEVKLEIPAEVIEKRIEARRAYHRAWYAKNRESRIELQKRYKPDRREYYRERYKRRKCEKATQV